MIKVILADDHRMVRDGIGLILARESDIEVCAYACDGADAITLAQAWKPDVVLMDVCMPGVNGIDATLRIRKLLPRTQVVALSAQGERPFVLQMVEAGASGFVLKDQTVEVLARAIRAVAGGDTWLPELAAAAGKRTEKRLLSRRESAVLGELATGKRAREVAESMGISSKTVDTYRRRIMAKLGLSSQAELLRYAVALHASRSALPGVQVMTNGGPVTA